MYLFVGKQCMFILFLLSFGKDDFRILKSLWMQANLYGICQLDKLSNSSVAGSVMTSIMLMCLIAKQVVSNNFTILSYSRISSLVFIFSPNFLV